MVCRTFHDGRGGELGVQCAGLGLFHSIFRLISLTRTPQGLVSLVISSTCGSIVAASGRAKQCRKKDRGENGCNHDPPPCSHHRRMTGSAMSGAGDSLKHLNSEKLQKQTPAIYICIKRASLSIQVTWGSIFPTDLQQGKRSCRGKLTGEPSH